jgi:hypothetical protein
MDKLLIDNAGSSGGEMRSGQSAVNLRHCCDNSNGLVSRSERK